MAKVDLETIEMYAFHNARNSSTAPLNWWWYVELCRYIDHYWPLPAICKLPVSHMTSIQPWSLGDHQQMWDLICWKGLLDALCALGWKSWESSKSKKFQREHCTYYLRISKICKGPQPVLTLIVLVYKFHELRQLRIVCQGLCIQHRLNIVLQTTPHLWPCQSLNCCLLLLVLTIISMLVLLLPHRVLYPGHFWWLLSCNGWLKKYKLWPISPWS